jgi:hypothetical protein
MNVFNVLMSLILFAAVPDIATDQLPDSSAETGTLVMIGITPTTIFAAVDSKIESHDGLHDRTSSEKMIEVGKHSVCLTAGHAGFAEPRWNMAAALKGWVKANPKAEVPEAMDGLLTAAGESWEREVREKFHNPYLPGNRKERDTIVTLLCATRKNGESAVFKKKIVVQQRSFRMPLSEPLHQKLLSVGGVVDTEWLDELLFQSVMTQPHDPPAYRTLGLALTSDSVTMETLRLWHQEQTQPAKPGNAYPNGWDDKHVRYSMAAIFKSVEDHFGSQVGRPNNLIVIDAHGRRRDQTFDHALNAFKVLHKN